MLYSRGPMVEFASAARRRNRIDNNVTHYEYCKYEKNVETELLLLVHSSFPKRQCSQS